MSFSAHAAAWWSAWKWVAILVVALALSVWANLHQWRQAAIAPLREQVAARDAALEDSEALLASAQERIRLLDEAAGIVTAGLVAAGRDYRAASRARPITDPVCAPGDDRVRAINRALGQSAVVP